MPLSIHKADVSSLGIRVFNRLRHFATKGTIFWVYSSFCAAFSTFSAFIFSEAKAVRSKHSNCFSASCSSVSSMAARGGASSAYYYYYYFYYYYYYCYYCYYCLLPTAYYLLPPTSYLLPPIYHLLYLLPTTYLLPSTRKKIRGDMTHDMMICLVI